MEIERESIKKLDKLIERITLTGIATHNVELFVLISELEEIKKSILEEEKNILEEKKRKNLTGRIITSDNVDELDNGFGNMTRS